MSKTPENHVAQRRYIDFDIDEAMNTTLEQSNAKKESRQHQEARYGLFLGILAEKLGISGLNTDREDPNHAAVLAEQLETIKKVFDQLFTVSKLLRLSPDQARSFSIFEKNSRSLDFIIPALDPDILSHQDLLAFVNSLKPTVFTSYEQILKIAKINDPANSEGKQQIITQLMSDLGVNTFSIRKLVKFFETKPTLAQVREEMAKKGKLRRLCGTVATLLGVAAISISCLPTTPEATTTPPGAPATEVEPTVKYTPSYTPSKKEELINPNSYLQLETQLSTVEINKESNTDFWNNFDDNQNALRQRMFQYNWLNGSNYVMTVVVINGDYKHAAVVTSGGTTDGTLAPGMVVISTTLPEVDVGNATGYTYGVLPGAETATPEPAKTPEAPTPTVTPTIVVPEEMVGGQLTPEQIAETEQMIIDRNIRGQLDQLGIHVNIIGIDETVSDPTGEYAVKRLGDWLALEKITAEEDGSRSYILFNHNNGEVAEVMVKKNEYVTISSDGNWVVLNADGQPAQEIEWQKVGQSETTPEAEAYQTRRNEFLEFFLERRENNNFEPITVAEMIADPSRYKEVMTVVETNPETGHTMTFTIDYDPSTIDKRGIPPSAFFDDEGNNITGKMAIELLQEIDAFFKNKYNLEGMVTVYDAERVYNQYTSRDQTTLAGYELPVNLRLSDVDQVNVHYHGIPTPQTLDLDYRLRTLNFANKDDQKFGVTAFINYTGSDVSAAFAVPMLGVETDTEDKQKITLDVFVFEASQSTLKESENALYYLNQSSRLYKGLGCLTVTKVDWQDFLPNTATSASFLSSAIKEGDISGAIQNHSLQLGRIFRGEEGSWQSDVYTP